MDSRSALIAIQGIKKAEDYGRRLKDIKTRLKAFASSLEDIKTPKYSGWYILLGKDDSHPSGHKFLGFFNPDKCADDGSDEPEWSIAVPIWDMESIPEFMGW